jgi:hypothetical protein
MHVEKRIASTLVLHGGGGWNSRDDAILFNSLLIEAGGGW